jgi:hypothetical protein
MTSDVSHFRVPPRSRSEPGTAGRYS